MSKSIAGVALGGATVLFTAGCGLSPSEPPDFDEAIECATINALAGLEEPESEEAKLVDTWLTYAARQTGQSAESASIHFDEEWEKLEKKITEMSDSETISFSLEQSMKCVGFEETYQDELQTES